MLLNNNQLAWQSSFFDASTGYSVQPIQPKDSHYFLLNIHYAKRIPNIIHAFGLFESGSLVGVITYGMPASTTLVTGIAGDKWSENVLELNRLCLLNNKPHEASRLVGQSLKLLPKPKIIVSFADTGEDHEGIVYQATNFIYTGTTAPHKDWAVKGLENAHSRSFGHLFNGNATLQQLKEHFGDDFYYKERTIKHRYIMLLGSKTQKKEMARDLKYKPVPYPKKGLANG